MPFLASLLPLALVVTSLLLPARRSHAAVSPEAEAIHRRAIVIDGHNDIAWKLRSKANSSFDRYDISGSVPQMHTDIPRLRQGGIGAQFWSAYVPATGTDQGIAVRMTLEQIDLIHRMVARYPDVFEFALTANDIRRVHGEGKIGCLIGLEGGHSIGNSLGVLRMYYTLGARYMTLTHSDTIDWADSSTDEPRHHGLTDFGREVVREMNRLGMLVDISHTSEDTLRDALETSRAPVIASHSSAQALAKHSRNISDDLLKAIAGNGGVVMVNFFSGFLVPESADFFSDILEVNRTMRQEHPDDEEYERVRNEWRKMIQRQITEGDKVKAGTPKDIVDHIDHIVKVAGIDHVGLGADYDGVSLLPQGMEDVSGYPLITQELLDRGYNEEDIKKVLGENLLRVLARAEEVASEWK